MNSTTLRLSTLSTLLILMTAQLTWSQIEMEGFIAPDEMVDSFAILPAPPQVTDIAFLADKAAYEQGKLLRKTEYGPIAIQDASLSDQMLGAQFSEVLGVNISQTQTPATFLLLKRLIKDMVSGTLTAKQHYQRIRPFELYNEASCTPDDEEFLRTNGSYPSGHTTFGWLTALALTEMFPEKSTALLKRGYEFGASRVICGVHWQSDVDSGYIIAAAIMAKLQSNEAFREQFNQAKAELTLLML